MSLKEKSRLVKIIQKENPTEEDKKEIKLILENLPKSELESLLGKYYINSNNTKGRNWFFNKIYFNYVISSLENFINIYLANKSKRIRKNVKNSTYELLPIIVKKTNEISFIPVPQKLAAAIVFYCLQLNHMNYSVADMCRILFPDETTAPHYVNQIKAQIYKLLPDSLKDKIEYKYEPKESKISIILSKNSNKIQKFPMNFREILCNQIYLLIIREKLNDVNIIVKRLIKDIEAYPESVISNKFIKNWIRRIPINYLNLINEKFIDPKYMKAIKIYFSDLVKVIIKLEELNQKYKIDQELLNINQFKKYLKKIYEVDFGELIIIHIFNSIKRKNKEFMLERGIQQSLFDSGKVRECARCHNILPYSAFGFSQGFIKVMCKQCRQEVEAINDYKVKIGIINDEFGGKCLECHTDVEQLPALQIHHPDPELKTFNMGEIHAYNYIEILERIKSEKAFPLCSNCHSLKQASVFLNFKKLILRQDLFQMTPEEIDRLIYYGVQTDHSSKNLNPKQKTAKKYLIKNWIKKRYIIEQLFNGKCVGCGKVSIEMLPALQFHHKIFGDYESELDNKLTWTNLRNLDIFTIVKILKEQDCSCLCGNCHKMMHSPLFINLAKEINGEEYAKLVKNNYKSIAKNVQSLKIKEIKIKDPIKIIGAKKRSGKKPKTIWKKNLLAFYELAKAKADGIISSTEFRVHLGKTRDTVQKALRDLIDRNLIRITQERYGSNPALLKLTEEGIKTTDKLVQSE